MKDTGVTVSVPDERSGPAPEKNFRREEICVIA